MNKHIKKILCVLLAASLPLCFTGCGKKETAPDPAETAPEKPAQPVYTEAPDSVVKAETVYVNMDPSGAAQNVTVSDWLHTDRARVRVTDKTDLAGVVNVKGVEEPVTEGEDLIWNMTTTDLYYRGYSDKALPVNFEIRYFVNGSETAPENIAGVTGELKIEIRAVNSARRTVRIDGKDVEVYDPMVVAGGMLLNESEFSNVRITNGRTIGDGTREIAFFVGLPGMAQSLGLTDADLSALKTNVLAGLDFSDTFTIEADIRNAQFGNMYFAVLPLASLEGSVQLDETLSGVEKLLTSVGEVASAIYEIDPEKLIDTLTTNSDRISTLTDVIRDAKDVFDENRALIDVITKYATPENLAQLRTLAEDVQALDLEKYAALLGSDEMKALAEDVGNTDFAKYRALLANPLFTAFFSDLSGIAADARKVLPQLEDITSDVSDGRFRKVVADCEALGPAFEGLSKDLSAGDAAEAAAQLPETVEKLTALFRVLQENSDVISTLSDVFSEENVNRLSEALNESRDVNINALLSSVSGLTRDPAATAARIRAIAAAAKERHVYSDAPAGMETSVLYVYRTPGVAAQ